MILVTQQGSEYALKFRYDPELIQLVKEVPGRRWLPDKKVWTLPVDKLGWFLNRIKGTPYEYDVHIQSDEDLNVNADVGHNQTVPNIDISGVNFQVAKGLKPFKHQLDFMKFAIHRQNSGNMNGLILADTMGLGKALSLDTKIPTPKGFTTMGDLHVGDTVFNEEGQPVQVLRVYDHESLDMYKVTFVDNTSVVCCKDHLWYMKEHAERSYKVKNTDWLVHGGGSSPLSSNRPNTIKTYEIPKCKPVQFEHRDVYLDPWALGALLGDGYLSINGVQITSSHPDVISMFRRSLPSGYVLSNPDKSGVDYTVIQSEKSRCNKVFRYLKDLGLIGTKSRTKFIPDLYKFNDIECRWAVLQGLMDTHGYASTSNHHSYTTMSAQLAQDVVFLVQSLGGLATITEQDSKLESKSYGTAYTVTIRIDDPAQLYRCYKRRRAKRRRYLPLKKFESIDYVGKLPGRCITVSGDSHLYLCGDFIVTHNTVETMNIALYNKQKYNFKHCLIICCINTSKYNWYNDIEYHTNGKEVPYILGSRLKKDGVTVRSNTGSAEKLKDLITGHMYGDKKQPKLPYFIVLNIEALRHRQGRVYPISDEICKLIDSGKINMIAIDEVHKNASPSSLQGKQLLRIKKYTESKCEWIPITGTPIVNKPTDVFLPLKLIDGHNFSSYYLWENHFCLKGGFGGHEIIGYKNIPELKQMLEGNMIRRLKEDVLDLPDKIFFTEYVENTQYQKTLYNKVANDIISQKDNILRGLNPLSSMMRLRQINDAPEIVDLDLKVDKTYLSKNSKMKRLIEMLDEAYERGEKSLVFSNWVEPLRTLYKFVSKRYGVCCCTGTMSVEDREAHKKAFQSNPKYSVMIGTVGAMGISHNLNAAHNVFFLDEPWTATDKDQAIDRAHRANTTHPVNIVTLLVKDTVDDRVHDIVYNKDQISKYIVDNKVDLRNSPELFDLILSDTKSK